MGSEREEDNNIEKQRMRNRSEIPMTPAPDNYDHFQRALRKHFITVNDKYLRAPSPRPATQQNSANNSQMQIESDREV